ncbi:MAG: twin-arginine translocation signal domain-containing protein, partial [Deltaproteobacteria bacterium]|nr:twin-arginine translocation signal domain-containing protein [Deltaproteobacteria bacterium]
MEDKMDKTGCLEKLLKEKGLTRRELIKGAAALGVATALPASFLPDKAWAAV